MKKLFYSFLKQPRLTQLILICGLLYFITSLSYVELPISWPSGDEPHYLVISQTLVKYHSLNVMLDYQHGDYHAFYPLKLYALGTTDPPHVTHNTRGELLPVHNIGGPVLWLLPFALLGRLGAVLFMSFITLLIVINIYKCLLTMGIQERNAFLVSLAYAVASPLYLYSHLTFVEPLGALVSIYILRMLFQQELTPRDVVLSACLLSSLPWIHIRFVLIEIPLFFFMLYRIYRYHHLRYFAYYLIPCILFFLGLELYNYLVWGTLNPAANQMNNNTAPLEKLPFNGLLGIFFDQEYGIFLNFPIFIFMITGILLTIHKKFRLYHVFVLATSLPYIIGFTTLRHWSGGYCPPARFMLVLLPIYCFYIAYAVEHMQSKFIRLLFWATFSYGCLYNLVSLFPPHNGFNGETGRNTIVGYIQLFGRHVTDLLPSMFLPNQTGLFILWVVIFVGGAFLLVFLNHSRHTVFKLKRPIL